MKRFLIVLTLLLVSASAAIAADKTKALLAIENARTAVTKLEQRGVADKTVADDIANAKKYLGRAETMFKENVSWLLLGNLNDSAEPQVLNFAEMAEIAANTGLSRIEKSSQEAELKGLEKEIATAKAKLKVFEDRSKEIRKLKQEVGKYDAAAQEIVTLKATVEMYKADKAAAEVLKNEKLDLQKQLETAKSQVATLTGQLETLKMEKATMTGQIETLNSDKSQSELQIKKLNERVIALETEQVTLRQKKEQADKSEKQLSSINRSVAFRAELSKLGAITEITDRTVTLVLPRTIIIKTGTKAHQISNSADANLKELLAIIPQYPEYDLSIKVFGFGAPTRLENRKSAEQMAIMARDYLALKLGKAAGRIPASGDTAPSPLFSSKAKESNKRIEITFTLKQPQQAK